MSKSLQKKYPEDFSQSSQRIQKEMLDLSDLKSDKSNIFRAELEKFCRKGVRNARLVNRAKKILALDISGSRKAERQKALISFYKGRNGKRSLCRRK